MTGIPLDSGFRRNDDPEKRLVTTGEAARVLGVTERTVQRWYFSGKIEGKFISGKRGGAGGQVLMVYVDKDSSESGVRSSEKEKIHPDRYRVHRGEPGRFMETEFVDGIPIINRDAESPSPSPSPPRGEGVSMMLSNVHKNDHFVKLNEQRVDICQQEASSSSPSLTSLTALNHDGFRAKTGGDLPQAPIEASLHTGQAAANGVPDRESPPPCLVRSEEFGVRSEKNNPKASLLPHPQPAVPSSSAGGGGAAYLPVVPSPSYLPLEGAGTKIRNDKMERIGNLRYALIQAFNEEASRNHRPKAEIIEHFLSLYNTGVSHPEIYREIGSISRSTLYNWISAGDPGDLTPQYGGAGQSKITEHEKNLLLTLCLHQNRLKIAYAISLAKEYLVKKRIPSPSSPATLRRFIDQFKKEHYDIWVLRREGEKALNDKVIPYAERDPNLLGVGDGLVADGHRLNFQVIHPVTGKPCRPALVLFWDWRSSYPLGWEIMLEENIQCVTSALRNAILALGKIPRWVYLDNGKAFKAKIFTEDINLEETELPGMFARLNINYHFAQPYNAQAKPIERIFGILNEQLERIMESYTGASISDKPAWTKRNEKFARSLHDQTNIPTIPEASEAIRAWRNRYAERRSRGRDGVRPIDIFNEGKGPGVDPAELIYLMMDREIKTVHRNGITWLNWHWYDEALYGLKDKVVIRYSLTDLSQIYIFHKNEFLCVARPVEKVHPMASESENPKDMEAVKEVLRLKNKVKHTTRKLCDLLETKTAAQIDWSRSKTPEIAETIQKIEETKKPKVVNISPFLNEIETPTLKVEIETSKTERPWFADEYERYRWVMQQPRISPDDRDFIDDFRGRSLLYKNTVFTDQKHLDMKVIKSVEGENDEGRICDRS